MKIVVDYLIRGNNKEYIDNDYFIRVSKKYIEVTPEEFCQLRSDCHSRPDIFPENAFDCNISYNIEGLKELEAFYEKKQRN